MSLPRHLFTPTFRHQHLGRSFAAIVGILVFIATFATAGEAALLTLGLVWGQTADSRITVEIPAVGDESTTPQGERVKQVSKALQAMPDVGLVMPLSDEEVARLLKPWFSEPELLKALPLPTLIDVERRTGSTLNAEQIQKTLKAFVSDVRVDDHGAWVQDVWRLVHGLLILGGTTILLTGATLMIAVTLICRAIMASEQETIALLHTLGADDHDIARHFQLQARRLSARAAGWGFLAALVITSALLFMASPLVDLSSLQLSHWIGLGFASCTIPLIAIILAGMTTRLSVMRLIKSFP